MCQSVSCLIVSSIVSAAAIAMCNKITRPLDPCDDVCATPLRCSQTDQCERDVKREVEDDILALSTVYLKLAFSLIKNVFVRIRNSKAYSILTRTTQPAHVLIMLAALLVAASLYPSRRPTSADTLCKFIYAAASAAHFGSQIWMTFASGLSLYFSLPRHHFGEVQKVLFPLYFTLTSLLSLITLLSHLRLSRSGETTFVLTACFFTELFVRLYLCGPLVRLICTKNDMEAKHGLGMEVGKLAKDSELFDKKEYLVVHRRFRRLHMSIAISNVVCIALSTVHLYFAVSHISFEC